MYTIIIKVTNATRSNPEIDIPTMLSVVSVFSLVTVTVEMPDMIMIILTLIRLTYPNIYEMIFKCNIIFLIIKFPI